jgi:GntR family transcriptional regulator / MocR family aminotransferase
VQRDWASSLDLHVELEGGGGRRAALERAVRGAIRDGRLRPGDRLPSTRALAGDLGLARGTVADAYSQLAVEGYLRTSPGAPTRVADGIALGAPPHDSSRPHDSSAAGESPAAIAGSSSAFVAPPGARFDLRAGLPDLGAFPRSAWLRALRRVLATAPDRALVNDDPRGRPELRRALAGYLGRTRGVLADPERIVVASGFTQGIALLCHALRASGAGAVAMEDPCLFHQRTIAEAAGLDVLPLPVDDEGAVPDVPAGAAAAVVTPAHQFPLGPTLAPDRRAALLAWARDGGVLVEDDYDGEFRYDRQPPGAIQGLDPERVVYAGTVSKTLTPGLRIGWLQLPRRLVEPVLEAKRLTGDTQALDQLALAELLTSGAYDRHVRRMRQRYRRRRDRLLALLGEAAPEGRALGVAAGLHVVLELPGEEELLARAAERSLALTGLRAFWHRPEGRPGGVVLGYAAPPEHAYAQTLAALQASLSAGRSSSRTTASTASRR